MAEYFGTQYYPDDASRAASLEAELAELRKENQQLETEVRSVRASERASEAALSQASLDDEPPDRVAELQPRPSREEKHERDRSVWALHIQVKRHEEQLEKHQRAINELTTHIARIARVAARDVEVRAQQPAPPSLAVHAAEPAAERQRGSPGSRPSAAFGSAVSGPESPLKDRRATEPEARTTSAAEIESPAAPPEEVPAPEPKPAPKPWEAQPLVALPLAPPSAAVAAAALAAAAELSSPHSASGSFTKGQPLSAGKAPAYGRARSASLSGAAKGALTPTPAFYRRASVATLEGGLLSAATTLGDVKAHVSPPPVGAGLVPTSVMMPGPRATPGAALSSSRSDVGCADSSSTAGGGFGGQGGTTRYAVRGRAVTAYAPAEWGPSDAARAGAAPVARAELEHVYGYRAKLASPQGHPCTNALVVLGPQMIAYAAASVVVVLESESNTQAFYCEHDEDVLSVAAHVPELGGAEAEAGGSRVVLASGQLGRHPPIHVWSLESGETLSALTGAHHERGIGQLAFSPDGARLASMGLDTQRTMIVWDWRRKAPLVSAKVHTEPIHALAFSPASAGDILVAVGVRAFKIFGLSAPSAQGAERSLRAPPLVLTRRGGVFGKLGSLKDGDKATLLSLAFTADGQAVTGTKTGDVLIWAGQEVVSKLRGAHESPVYSVCVLPRTGFIVSADKQGVLAAWDATFTHTGSRTLSDASVGLAQPAVRAISPLPTADGTQLLVGCTDGSVREVDLATGAARVWLQGHTAGEVCALGAHPTDAGRFASASRDRTVRLWSAEHRWPLACVSLSEEARALDWAPDGSALALALEDGTVMVLGEASLEALRSAKRREVRCVPRRAARREGAEPGAPRPHHARARRRAPWMRRRPAPN